MVMDALTTALARTADVRGASWAVVEHLEAPGVRPSVYVERGGRLRDLGHEVRLAHEAGMPEDVLVLVPGGPEVCAALTADVRIQGVAFTGSGSLVLAGMIMVSTLTSWIAYSTWKTRR